MEIAKIIVAVVLFAVAVLIAVRTLFAGADGRYRSVGWFGSIAVFGAALWASLSLIGG